MYRTTTVTITNTTTANVSSPAGDTRTEEIMRYFIVVCLAIIIIISIAGNCLVCIAFKVNKHLRTVSNSFILSLAVSDLITTIFVMPWDLEIILKKGSWSHGKILCQFYTTVYLVSAPASTLNLLAVSIDRFRLIRDPFAYQRQTTPFRASIIITFIWVYSSVMAFLPLMGWKDKTPWPVTFDTECPFDISWVYSIMMSLLNFVIPPLIMTAIYFKIYRIASGHIARIHRVESTIVNSGASFSEVLDSISNSQRSSRAGSDSPIQLETQCNGNHSYQAHLTPPCTNYKFPHVGEKNKPANLKTDHERKHSTRGNTEFEHAGVGTEHAKMHDINRASIDLSHLRKGSTNSHVDVARRNNHGKRKSRTFSINGTFLLRKNIKAAKSLAIIVGAFFLCWYPFTIVSMAVNACIRSNLGCQLPPIYVEQLLLILGFLNSMLNPFLYGLHNKEFKKTYKRILIWK